MGIEVVNAVITKKFHSFVSNNVMWGIHSYTPLPNIKGHYKRLYETMYNQLFIKHIIKNIRQIIFASLCKKFKVDLNIPERCSKNKSLVFTEIWRQIEISLYLSHIDCAWNEDYPSLPLDWYNRQKIVKANTFVENVLDLFWRTK